MANLKQIRKMEKEHAKEKIAEALAHLDSAIQYSNLFTRDEFTKLIDAQEVLANKKFSLTE